MKRLLFLRENRWNQTENLYPGKRIIRKMTFEDHINSSKETWPGSECINNFIRFQVKLERESNMGISRLKYLDPCIRWRYDYDFAGAKIASART